MSWIAVAIGGSALLSTGASIYASNKASSAQIDASARAAETTLETTKLSIEATERALERQIKLNEPFREAGLKALPILVDEVTRGAPTFDDFVQSPEAAAIREQELSDITKVTERSAAARGNLFSPATQEELQNRALIKTDASKLGQYDKSLDIRQSDISNLTNLVNIGRGATAETAGDIGQSGANVSNLISGSGQSLANLQIGAGDARASNYINTANAIGSAVSQGAENYAVYKALKP